MRLYIHALGCKTNQYENQALIHQFQARGFSLTEDCAEADVCVLNTCTVTAEAGRKSRQFLRRMRQRSPQALIVAMGCHAQLEDVSADCDLVCGTNERNAIVGRVCAMLTEAGRDLSCAGQEPSPDSAPEEDPEGGGLSQPSQARDYEELGIVSVQTETRAQIKIEDGCDSFCSYCAIPLARGRVRSRRREDILREAEALAAKGYREIVLTGIHICSFERELGRSSDALAELCLELNRIDGLARIRLGSLEPLSVTPSFIAILKQADKVCPHFHLSLQSGSPTVLQRMNRRYTPDQFRERVEWLRAAYDRPAVTTDIMVAFPEESEEEFVQSLNFAESIGFARMHIFRYSIRPGTAAAKMRQVPGRISQQRAEAMAALSERMAGVYAADWVGQTVRVLLEQAEGEGMVGYSDRYLRVAVENCRQPAGHLLEVRITAREADGLRGVALA